MNNLKVLIIGGVVLLGLGYGVGRYLQPAEVKIEIKEVEKQVVKTKTNVVTVVKETTNKDGTTTKETTITDKTEIVDTTKKSKEENTEIVAIKPQYRIRGGAGYDFKDNSPQYVIGGEKRFWGPVSLGLDATVKSNMEFKAVNLTASWEF